MAGILTKTITVEDWMRYAPARKHLLLAVLAITLPLLASPARASEFVEHPELETLFERHGVEGAFVLLDTDKDRLHVVNPGRIDERRYPASTFKIANSLIALETGAIADENEIIPYGGRPQPIKSWERDMSMSDAIKVSNVPVYQELARRIGLESYAKWLDRLEYGNRMAGKNVERFWLEGPLAISPLEQVEFVAKLAKGELAASDRSQNKVRDILLVETDDPRQAFRQERMEPRCQTTDRLVGRLGRTQWRCLRLCADHRH